MKILSFFDIINIFKGCDILLIKLLKKGLLFSIVIFSAIFFSGCKKNANNYLNNPIAIVYIDNKPYILNNDQSLYDLSEYDSIMPYFSDYLIVKKDNLFGYIKNTGEPITPICYTEAYPFSEEKAVVAIGSNFYLIDDAGQTIYTFDSGVSSVASFSDGFLAIIKDHKCGYLVYDAEKQSFSYLYHPQDVTQTLDEANFIYDYCGDFNEGYAVVGTLDENQKLKYTHIDNNGNYLYDLQWDYANNFVNGYAVVGNYMNYKVRVYCSDIIGGDFEDKFDDLANGNIQMMTYMYVRPDGTYLSEQTSNADGTISNTPKYFAMARDFNNDVALVAQIYLFSNEKHYNHNYNFSSENFFYNYNFIDHDGNFIVSDNIPNNWRKGSCLYDDFFVFNDYYIATYFSIPSNSWSIKNMPIDQAYDFSAITDTSFDLKKYSPNEPNYDELILNDFPWIKDYLTDYCAQGRTPSYVTDRAVHPYRISKFQTSKYILDSSSSEPLLLAKAEIFSGFKDSYGLIGLTLVDSVVKDDNGNDVIDENGNIQTIKKPLLSYIIPPLYDEIIF